MHERLVLFKTDDEIVTVETSVDSDAEQALGLEPVWRSKATKGQGSGSLSSAFDKLTPAFHTIADQVRTWARIAGPDEMELRLGVKLSVEAGAIIASTASEANFEVTLRWNQRHKSGRDYDANGSA
ncbi:CU044_2847 family protein [Longispora sp. K20-0274]|uniref:CU044_2847 family protein n=1 Tax=Longispora sp. K20-0274 TaxID=3088255 RepID=UPI00399AF166